MAAESTRVADTGRTQDRSRFGTLANTRADLVDLLDRQCPIEPQTAMPAADYGRER